MYRFLKHTADIMFEVEARTLNEMFEDSGKAVMATMVELDSIKPKTKKSIKIKSKKIEDLLYDYLSELVYLKDSDFMLFSKFKINVDEKTGYVDAEAWGEKINIKKHKLGVDVKAVTMHEFLVEKRKDRWYAKVLLDV